MNSQFGCCFLLTFVFLSIWTCRNWYFAPSFDIIFFYFYFLIKCIYILKTKGVFTTCCRCFLLTPKLLPGLEYSDACTVLNIFNGPYVPEASKGISFSFTNKSDFLKLRSCLLIEINFSMEQWEELGGGDGGFGVVSVGRTFTLMQRNAFVVCIQPSFWG